MAPSPRKPRNHPCPMCYKAFDRPSTLQKHLLVHTGEKAFVCHHCSRRFSVASNRNRHLPRCPALKSRLAPEVSRRNSLAASDVTDASDAPLSCITSVPSALSFPDEASPLESPPFWPSATDISPGPQRRKRFRRPPSPVRWVPSSLEGMHIVDLKTYGRDYSARLKKEAQETRARATEEKARQKEERRQQQHRRPLKAPATVPDDPFPVSPPGVRSECDGGEGPDPPQVATMHPPAPPSLISATVPGYWPLQASPFFDHPALLSSPASDSAAASFITSPSIDMDHSYPLEQIPHPYGLLPVQCPDYLTTLHEPHLLASSSSLGPLVSVPVPISMPIPIPPGAAIPCMPLLPPEGYADPFTYSQALTLPADADLNGHHHSFIHLSIPAPTGASYTFP